MSWREQAECVGHPPEWWFPLSGVSPDPRALELCNICPVQEACLEDALAMPYPDDHYLRGGLTRAQRRRIREGRKPIRACVECGTTFPIRAHQGARQVCSDDCRRIRHRRQQAESHRRTA